MKTFKVTTKGFNPAQPEIVTTVTADSKADARRAIGGKILKIEEVKDPWYADLDEETGLYCVFHTEWSHASASFASKEEAEQEAEKRNKSEASV